MQMEYEQLDHNIETKHGVVSVDQRLDSDHIHLETSGFSSMPMKDGSPNPTPDLIPGYIRLSADEARIVSKALLSAADKAEKQAQQERESLEAELRRYRVEDFKRLSGDFPFPFGDDDEEEEGAARRPAGSEEEFGRARPAGEEEDERTDAERHLDAIAAMSDPKNIAALNDPAGAPNGSSKTLADALKYPQAPDYTLAKYRTQAD